MGAIARTSTLGDWPGRRRTRAKAFAEHEMIEDGRLRTDREADLLREAVPRAEPRHGRALVVREGRRRQQHGEGVAVAPQRPRRALSSRAFGRQGPPLPGQRRGVRRELQRLVVDVVDVARRKSSEPLAVPGPRGCYESRQPRLAAFFDAVAVVLFIFAFRARYIIRVAARPRRSACGPARR